jgi:glycosyltransferase involved in cell wall biosynthesis
MPSTDVLISVCLPVRNAGDRVSSVIESVLAQDHTDLELVISDNASTDDTEDVCRKLAATDDRIVYVRQSENIGLNNNFNSLLHRARGTFLRWVSDDDWLAPTCLSRCRDEFLADDRLVLVTMGSEFVHEDGTVKSAVYSGCELTSDDPMVRLQEMLRLLNESYLIIDPEYGLMRRSVILDIPRRNRLRDDQIFAVKLALAGPWGHVRETVARRGYREVTRKQLVRTFDAPVWTAHAATTLQGLELMRWMNVAPQLSPAQRRQARAAVLRWYVGRQHRTITRRAKRLVQGSRRSARA